MSDTATAHHDDGHLSLNNDNKKLLMWLFLGSDCMFFGTLISTHLIYRKIYPESFDPTSLFSLELTSFSTFILLMSSFLMALAVSAMHKGELKSFRRNVLGVIFFGLIFLGCQVYEFAHFVHEGLTLSTNTFGSTFYMMTGTHGVHVAIGIFWLICMYFYSHTGKMDAHESAVDVEIAGLYWHFVDIVWIVIFTAVYLIEFI
ncbi:cytochrome c oxidase subunit 3 [Coraliomargarita sp. SDUM461003]|uniref:Cytochrome c oxidase subunit 3 n=1 Tax=Thalassobacterium maritimum TaxID=3041265 RepID=A0ABU1AUH7_9BACT|nr:cytochrome c oxidase subunit 3 [Coraliomargarita sp. SDUM461003]MDQ8207809.1 cytochrome c oxidase subunit 3 [Coraliomargarita sp. SDUM461003]